MFNKIKRVFTKEYSSQKNASIYLIASFFSFGLSILTLPVFTRLLNPTDFGNTLLFILFGKLIVGFVNFNLHFATYRYYFDYKNNFEEFKIINTSNFLFLIFLLFITIIIGKFTASFIINYYHNQIDEKIILVSLTSGFLDYFILYLTTILSAQLRAVGFAFITILNILLNSALSIFFIIEFDLTLWGRIYGIIGSQIIVFIITLYLCRKSFTKKINVYYLKKSLKLTSPMIPQMALGLSQNYLDKSILSFSKGSSSLGYYSLGVNFATILKTIMDSVEKAWSPIFFSKAIENTYENRNDIAKGFMALAFFYMAIGLGVIYFSEEAIKLLTTKQYYSAIYVVPIYVYFYLFAIFGYLSNAQLSFSKKLKFILPGSFAGAIINIVLNILLIPKFGAIGAALSSSITSLVTQIILYYYGMKYFPLPINISKIVLLYLVLIFFTSFFYILLFLNPNYFVKIISKLLLLSLFVAYGFWKNLFNTEHLQLFTNNKYINMFISKINLRK